MRQTAVEWLVDKICVEVEMHDEYGEVNGIEFWNAFRSSTDLSEYINKAKEMEKQQIIDAGNTCSFKQHIHSRKVDLMSLEELEDYAQKDAINVGEQYYNETFE